MKSEWSKISLFFLFLIALLGTLLRSTSYIPIPFEYVNLVHAHSHTAFQGWVYLVMMLFLTRIFLTEKQIEKGRYPLQFKLTVFMVVGILVSFSLQGYGLYSIVFSTLFQLLNYWFIFNFFRDTKKLPSSEQNSISLKLIKTGLWFGILSTLLPYAIGIAAAKGLKGTEVYNSLVYSFLHLQYNGWFLFVVLGLFFNLCDRHGITYDKKTGVRFYWLLTIAVIPAISLSLIGMEFSNSIRIIAYFSAGISGLSLFYFVLTISGGLLRYILKESVWFKLFLLSFLVAFILKTVLQSLSVFPFFESYAFHNKSIIIAYLHLSLIGSISFLFIALLIERKWLIPNGLMKVGSALLLLGFVTTEILLVLEGFGIFHDQILLITGSISMAIGVLMLVISRRSDPKNQNVMKLTDKEGIMLKP